MILQVEIKNVYGRDRVYPVCEKAKLLARIAKTTTLSDDSIVFIKELGFTFETKEPQV